MQDRLTRADYDDGTYDEYRYIGLGLRVWMRDRACVQHYFVTDGFDPASAVVADCTAMPANSSTLAVTYTPGISERKAGQTSRFYHQDALGSTRFIADSAGAVTDSFLYDAFGVGMHHEGSSSTPFQFVGKAQYQTDDSGLMLLGHRYYDAYQGRFISEDPARDEMNWYAYCGNNLLVAADPSGLEIVKRGVSANAITKDEVLPFGISVEASLALLLDTNSGDMGLSLTLGGAIGSAGTNGTGSDGTGLGWSVGGVRALSDGKLQSGVSTGQSTGAFGGVLGAVGVSGDKKTNSKDVSIGVGDGGGVYHSKTVTVTLTLTTAEKAVDRHIVQPVNRAVDRFILQPWSKYVERPGEAAAKQFVLNGGYPQR
ncbi:MAG TPA: RHS repeat-associated core domain-containing protein [Armatimonadota bacterium]